MGPLTGQAAVEALGVYFRLGSTGARFDAAAVARAVRTRKGRTSVFVAIRLAARSRLVGATLAVKVVSTTRTRLRRLRRRLRAVRGVGTAPARPRRDEGR